MCHGSQTKTFHYVDGVPNHLMCEGDVTTVGCAGQSCVKSVPSFSCSVKHVRVIVLNCTNAFMWSNTGLIVYDTARWDPLSVASSKKKKKLQEDSDSDEDEQEGVRLCESCDLLMDR